MLGDENFESGYRNLFIPSVCFSRYPVGHVSDHGITVLRCGIGRATGLGLYDRVNENVEAGSIHHDRPYSWTPWYYKTIEGSPNMKGNQSAFIVCRPLSISGPFAM